MRTWSLVGDCEIEPDYSDRIFHGQFLELLFNFDRTYIYSPCRKAQKYTTIPRPMGPKSSLRNVVQGLN